LHRSDETAAHSRQPRGELAPEKRSTRESTTQERKIIVMDLGLLLKPDMLVLLFALAVSGFFTGIILGVLLRDLFGPRQ
jgi:hypothetical protein